MRACTRDPRAPNTYVVDVEPFLRHVRAGEALTVGSKQFNPLFEDDLVSIQDQLATPPQVVKTGTLLEVLSAATPSLSGWTEAIR